MTIDLNEFCGEKNSLYDLSKPWSGREYSYASDGRILVMVPKNDVPENLEYEQKLLIKNGFMSLLDNHKDIHDWDQVSLPLPDLGPEEGCYNCSGKGWFKTSICPECGGSGGLTFSSKFHDYEFDCRTCGGDGYVRGGETRTLCGRCHEVGKFGRSGLQLRIGGTLFDGQVLRKVAKLPGVRIKPYSGAAAVIKFDGGCGVVMPLRESREEEEMNV